MKGIFVAVVGPSGAGKDSVMREVQRLSPNVTIARRVITRQVSDVTEESEGVDQQEFLRRANSGAFALSWQAHGLSYAIPATVSNDLARGRHVLANISRRMVDDSKHCFKPCLVVMITAPIDVLAARIATRGRETADDIAVRLKRAEDPDPGTLDLVIDNTGALEETAKKLLAILPQPSNANL